MAYEEILRTITLRAPSTAFSNKQYYAVVASSSAGYFKAGSSGAGSVVGILQDAPTVAGEACSIAVDGVSKVYAHKAISVTDYICSSTGGKVASSTAFASAHSGTHLFGTCLIAAASSGIGSVLLKSLGRTT